MKGNTMRRIYAVAAVAVLLLIGACGGSTLRPGRTITSELPVPANSLEEQWPEAESMLLHAGYPANGIWYAEEYLLQSGGPCLITAASLDFTPILALVTSEGEVLAAAGGREGAEGASLAIRENSGGLRLFVLSMDDRRGDYSLESVNLDAEEAEKLLSAQTLEDGRLNGWLPLHREYWIMEEMLNLCFEGMVYSDNLQTARIHPFSIEHEVLLTLNIPEADFDPIMALVSMESDRYGYITHNDDTEGLLPRITDMLEPGEYAAVVLGYSEGEGGAYVLTLDEIEAEMLTFELTETLHGEYSASRITAGGDLAILIWDDMQDEGAWETNLTPSTPTAPFAFSIETADIYSLTAASDIDVCLTILTDTSEGLDFLAYNDDSPDPEMGSDSYIETMLTPGSYIALVSSYFNGDEDEVSFMFEALESDFPDLRVGRAVEVPISFEEPSAYFRFDVSAANVYEISAEDEIIDPMIEVFLPDGTVLYDDDGGGELNSLLSIYPTEEQSGSCILKVTSFWGEEEGSITVELQRSSIN